MRANLCNLGTSSNNLALVRRISALIATADAFPLSLEAFSAFYTKNSINKINKIKKTQIQQIRAKLSTYLKKGFDVGVDGGVETDKSIVAGDIGIVLLVEVVFIVFFAD